MVRNMIRVTALLILVGFGLTSCDDYNIVEPRSFDVSKVPDIPICNSEKDSLDSSPEYYRYRLFPICWEDEAKERLVISYQIPESCMVRIAIYGMGGNRVRTLVDSYQPAGIYMVIWDMRDDRGRKVRKKAIYIVRMEAGAFSAERWFKL